ncbi:MAG TPA: type II and III secretion system protein family protein [Pseudohongiella sp.]|nr:type II and III secretion system protein family protein [Pseudohongiella sp.]
MKTILKIIKTSTVQLIAAGSLIFASAASAQTVQSVQPVRNNSDTSTVVEIRTGLQQVVSFENPVTRTSVGRSDVVNVSLMAENALILTAIESGNEQIRVWLEGQRDPHLLDVRVIPPVIDELTGNHQVSVTSESTVLRGDVRTLSEHGAILEQLEGVIDLSQQGSIQVQTDIKVVEVNKRLLESSGFFIGRNTPGSTRFAVGRSNNVLSFLSGDGAAPVSGDAGFSVIRGNTSGVLTALNALRTNGFASVLAEPSVVSMSGQSAAFLVGGEFPIPVRARDNEVTIQFKEYGVRLQITPTVLDDQRIVLKVAPEVSELNYNNAIQTGGVAVPALSVRRTDTTVQLGNGESFIISGLISNSTSQSADRVPGLGDIPLIGSLFRSTRFDREERELIMIVTPHLVSPIAAGVDLGPLPGESLRNYKPGLLELMLDPKSADYIERNTSIGFSAN